MERFNQLGRLLPAGDDIAKEAAMQEPGRARKSG
jgi:hypothetical protein